MKVPGFSKEEIIDIIDKGDEDLTLIYKMFYMFLHGKNDHSFGPLVNFHEKISAEAWTDAAQLMIPIGWQLQWLERKSDDTWDAKIIRLSDNRPIFSPLGKCRSPGLAIIRAILSMPERG